MWSHSVRRGCSPSHSRSVQTRVRVLKTVKPPWDRDDTSTVTANSCVSVCVCVCVSSVKLTPASNLNCGHVTAALWLAAGGHVCPKLQTHNINCVQPTHTDIHAHARRHKCTHTNTHTHTHTHTHSDITPMDWSSWSTWSVSLLVNFTVQINENFLWCFIQYQNHHIRLDHRLKHTG